MAAAIARCQWWAVVQWETIFGWWATLGKNFLFRPFSSISFRFLSFRLHWMLNTGAHRYFISELDIIIYSEIRMSITISKRNHSLSLFLSLSRSHSCVCVSRGVKSTFGFIQLNDDFSSLTLIVLILSAFILIASYFSLCQILFLLDRIRSFFPSGMPVSLSVYVFRCHYFFFSRLNLQFQFHTASNFFLFSFLIPHHRCRAFYLCCFPLFYLIRLLLQYLSDVSLVGVMLMCIYCLSLSVSVFTLVKFILVADVCSKSGREIIQFKKSNHFISACYKSSFSLNVCSFVWLAFSVEKMNISIFFIHSNSVLPSFSLSLLRLLITHTHTHSLL